MKLHFSVLSYFMEIKVLGASWAGLGCFSLVIGIGSRKRKEEEVLLTPEDLTEIAHILRRYVLHEEIAVSAVQLLWRLSWHEESAPPSC